MEDYELSEYYLGEWTGNGELEDFVLWLDHNVGQGYGYYYDEGDGSYVFNKMFDRTLHTNNMIYEIR